MNLLVAKARAARTGVQVYDHTNERINEHGRGITLEYRPPQEVFSQDSLASWVGIPVTVGHTYATDANVSEIAVGFVADAYRDGQFVGVTLILFDAGAADAVRRGDLVELSGGYQMNLMSASGTTSRGDHFQVPGKTPDGEDYDAVQYDIRLNHVALLPRGYARCGRECKVT